MVGPYGAVTWWGFSPALDLREECHLNILLVGCGDCRHVLKTLAKTYKWKKDYQLHIYVVESNLELLARHLLLLGIAKESKENLGLQEKCELFLELFGNSLIRPQTSEYIQDKATHFIRMVTDLECLGREFPLIDMSLLKFKERDMLEGIFKFWRSRDVKLFDITKCWDSRLRSHLEVRYDHRNNVYDWDYNMALHRKAPIIKFHEYKTWRDQGVAFEMREDASYAVANRTLASGLVVTKGGEKFLSRGYWGDIINSPFFAFGIESDEKRLFEKKNDVHVKSARDVSVHNVTSFMFEIANHKKYEPSKQAHIEDDEGHSRIKEIIEEVDELQVTSGSSKIEDDVLLHGDNVKVFFLPSNGVHELQKKNRFKELFDLVYFSNSMVHFCTPDTRHLLSKNAMLIIETTKYMLDLKEEQSREYLKKVSSMVERAGCRPLLPCDDAKDEFAYFKHTGE
ncbi:dynein axonemal assembly factor 3-like isoform X2 [Xenia sp. Carnegie-2017]|uniref:dynein axonemal assembly factor 3-like isoform X2 n=1 Tax=Xenia sp. Carnegie-2017 TaxID=2897299 RepID=UPI001F04757E|nr:dynein axonemal assembly factor 3-like isoform X2 [Xenia sp. Carnegie-2017]